MALNSTIEWTETTWNPVTGCTKISAGCANCYAERMAHRLKAMGQPNYAKGFKVTLHEHMLELPLRWRKPQVVFVNSMSDLFHDQVPDDFICEIFHVMEQAHWHRFQVLTKRSERLADMRYRLPWPDNVWMGVTVESNKHLHRLNDLKKTDATVKFGSMEPLLGPLPDVNLENIDWIIVGGESGPGARPVNPCWVREIRDQCVTQGVAFFFKQWGGFFKKRHGCLLDGREWKQMPRLASAAI